MPWKPGESGNPAGRPRGAKGLVPETIKRALLESFKNKGGAAYLEKLADERPDLYVSLLAKVLPAEIRADLGGDIPTLVIRNYTGRSIPGLPDEGVIDAEAEERQDPDPPELPTPRRLVVENPADETPTPETPREPEPETAWRMPLS